MTLLLAIDPGTAESGYCLFETCLPLTSAVVELGVLENVEMKHKITGYSEGVLLVLEDFESYGMVVGKEVFETLIWVGRFWEAWGRSELQEPARVTRREVKLHLCNSARAKDSNVNQALRDKFGPNAVGVKANKGPLYGIKSHAWAALAVAVTFSERVNV